MRANEKQVAGNHYKLLDGEQHWDRMYRLYGRGYFVGCATKYIERYHLKNGKEDLEKAIHFLEKLIELEYTSVENQSINNKCHQDDLKFVVSPKYGPLPPLKHELFGSYEGAPKYPLDYQGQMKKTRDDAMTGVPDHIRDAFSERSEKAKSQMAEMPESLQGAISPMLRNFWGGEEPLSQGYVNQDGKDV